MRWPKATKARRPRSKLAWFASLYLAIFFTAAATMQLFAFEDFPAIIISYDLGGFFSSYAVLVAALVVMTEVFAIPYLLFMTLSPLMRLLSKVAGGLSLVGWLGVGLWQSLTEQVIPNAGLFGARVFLPQGWWLVTYVSILIVLFVVVLVSGSLPTRKKRLAKHTS